MPVTGVTHDMDALVEGASSALDQVDDLVASAAAQERRHLLRCCSPGASRARA